LDEYGFGFQPVILVKALILRLIYLRRAKATTLLMDCFIDRVSRKSAQYRHCEARSSLSHHCFDEYRFDSEPVVLAKAFLLR
jgi:hypothetical protein